MSTAAARASAVTVTTTDGRTLQLRPGPLASGAEKVAFLTVDGRDVVAFYFGALRDRAERVERLQRIVSSYDPTRGAGAAYWRDAFCWPTGIVNGAASVPADFARAHSLAQPPLGVVMPVYRNAFFMQDRFGNRVEKEVRWFTGRKAGALVLDAEKGSLLTRLQVCMRLARAVRRLHFAGLAHSDLSNRNVLVDLRGGDACVIDIDALVVPGLAPPTVLGTPGYMAPEVVAGTALPSIETDRHALAVLFYELLLQRHPLRGTLVHSTRSAEEDEQLSMGVKALFVEHSRDPRNRSDAPITVAVDALGPYLAPLMRRAFEEALHAPARRPDAVEWEEALYRTLERLTPTPSGRGWLIVPDAGPMLDPWSGERMHRAVPMLRSGRGVQDGWRDDSIATALFHHRTLHQWHLDTDVRPREEVSRDAVAYTSFHEGAWWLVNLTDRAWTTAEGTVVARNTPVQLRDGLELSVSSRADGAPGRTWRVMMRQG
ncbi:MAG: lipopolysaccharide kinase InaA family protein [Gemmatimonadaceae bacterium]|nr:lipopolysaccharide kinase InaA family protein [Gemmatimonadaceae bacterium]